MSFRTIKIVSELRVKASPERVWDAITDSQLDWYPHTYGRDRCKAVVFEHKVGGRVYEDWGDGNGCLYSVVREYDRHRRLTTEGWLGMGISLEGTTELIVEGDETVIRSGMVASGDISDEMAEGIETHGNMDHYNEALRAWVEDGVSIRAAV